MIQLNEPWSVREQNEPAALLAALLVQLRYFAIGFMVGFGVACAAAGVLMWIGLLTF